jgi:type I restriction enzyme S subunit
MSKLEDLINKLCPNGVQFKSISEVVKINGYKQLGAADLESLKTKNGEIRLLPSSNNHDWYTDKKKANDYLCFGEIFTLGRARNANIKYCKGYFVSSNNVIVESNEPNKVLTRYLYFFVSSHIKDIYVETSTYPKFDHNSFNKLQVPVPPIEVQREIVRILDNFTELEAELKAELEARTKQYEYYRNKLLDFSTGSVGVPRIDKMLAEMCPNGIITYSIGTVCNVFTGGEPPLDCIKGNISDDTHPYAVWGNGKEVYGYSSSYKIDKDAVVISSIGANTGAVYFREAFFTPIIRLKVLIPKDNSLNMRFLYHALATKTIESKSSSVPNMNANEIKKLSVPVPPLEIQEEIVRILDTFSEYVSSISQGLPAEIELRRKQYEYYRDKLLTFKKLEV